MGWFRRVNQTSGAEEEYNDETGEVRAPSGPSPLQAQTAPSGTGMGGGGQTLTPNNPRVDGLNFGAALAEQFRRNPPQLPSMRVTNTGNVVLGSSPPRAAAPVEEEPTPEPLDFGDPALAPETEQAAETIRGLIADNNRGVELPAAPTYTADPALGRMVQFQEERQRRMQPMIDELIARVREQQGYRDSLPGWRRNMQDFSKWLGRTAGTHDLSQAGNVLWDMRDERTAREQGWDEQILRLTEAGMSLEEATALAESGVLSGEHGAAERTSVGQYNRGVQQAEINQRTSEASRSLQLALANLLQQGGADARAQQEQALSVLAQNPEYAGQATGELGRRAFPNSDNTASAFGETLAQEQRLRRLATQLAGPYARRSDLRNLRRDARRLDPSITDDEVQRLALILSTAGAQ